MNLVPEALARERFAQPFEHTVYLPDGTLAEETTGPTTDDWTAIDHISPFMQVAVLTTEDGGFYRHHGFNRAAMRNALVADLKAGRFVRGASTITMQLAKNLFLFRDKTLSRKLEEFILADYLEGTFTKKEMMELYLNVIEFGPDVYGITQAAFHYFGRKPDELNLAESLFLASLLPSPLRFHKLAEKSPLSESWTKHLRELMTIAAKNDLISPEELADGLKEDVVFHDPKDPLPPPRPSVSGTHFQATLDEGARWVARDAGASAPVSDAPSTARDSLLTLRAKLPEESAQAVRAVLGEHAARNRESVVQTRVLADREERRDRAALRVVAAVHDAADAGVDEGAGAHRAGLERDVGDDVLEPPARKLLRGSPDGDHLRMGRRIVQRLALVLTARELVTGSRDEHAADRNLADAGRDVRLRERGAHPRFVARRRSALTASTASIHSNRLRAQEDSNFRPLVP